MATSIEPGRPGAVPSAPPLATSDKESLLRQVKELAERYLDPDVTVLVPGDGTHAPSRTPTRLENGRVCTSTSEYVIRGKLGEGGMGVVYKAFDQKLKRDVAFKVLLRADDNDLLDRFIREQELTAALDHPNFVRVLSSGYVTLGDRSFPFYTMPLIRGRTFERLVLRRGVRDAEGTKLAREYPLRRVIGMVGQLALTLQSAHDKRIIHRDLKPSNVLIGPYGDVYVTDLGLAKFMSPKPTETGYFRAHVMAQFAKADKKDATGSMVLGTPYYMAPEQSLAPHAVDERADVFGLGALLYFGLTGERPRFREPAVDPATLESRRRTLVSDLAPEVGGEEALASLLARPRADIPEDLRRRLDELEEVKGLLRGMDYYKFRLTMRECSIIPPGELLESRRQAGPVDLPGQEPGADPEIEAFCLKAMAKDPRHRFPSALAFWEAVHRYLHPHDDAE